MGTESSKPKEPPQISRSQRRCDVELASRAVSDYASYQYLGTRNVPSGFDSSGPQSRHLGGEGIYAANPQSYNQGLRSQSVYAASSIATSGTQRLTSQPALVQSPQRFEAQNATQHMTPNRGQLRQSGNEGNFKPVNTRDNFNRFDSRAAGDYKYKTSNRVKPENIENASESGNPKVNTKPYNENKRFQNSRRNQNEPTRNERNNTNWRRQGDGPSKQNNYQNRGYNREEGPHIRRVGFKRLEQLSNLEPEETLIQLRKDAEDFVLRLKSDLSDDYVVIITKTLANICRSKFNENKFEVLKVVIDCNFFDRLFSYITALPYQDRQDKYKNNCFWNNVNEFWENLIYLFDCLISLAPNKAVEVLPKLIQASMGNILMIQTNHNVTIKQEIREQVFKLDEKIKLCEEELEKKQTIAEKIQKSNEPPDDFRTIPIYPTTEEVTTKTRSFVRENITEGGYRDVNHYLDVQFRLLREDFVGSLREGICEYRDQTAGHTKRKNHVVRIHRKAQFLYSQDAKSEIGVLVQFERNRKKKFSKFEFAKRFLYGALVCFTKDDFNSLIFGRIIDRNEKDLDKGLVVVGLEENSVYTLNTDYLMVECNVFFEPYYHVLKALQTIPVDSFPMERYIIQVNQHIQPPRYLQAHPIMEIEGLNVNVMRNSDWPSRQFIGLNESQYKAFQAALTKEFVIIQGPPGTGKTFLGLKIIQTLMKSTYFVNTDSPVLIVCYTNHALDQFLEGLIPYTQKIIRVGGRSQNEALKPFNIVEKRRGWFAKLRREGNPREELILRLGRHLTNVLECRKYYTDWLSKVNSLNYVMHFIDFKSVDPNFGNSWFATATKQKLEEWLFPDTPDVERVTGRRNLVPEKQENPIEEQDEYEDSENEDEDNIRIDDFDTKIVSQEAATIFSLEKSLETHSKLKEKLQNSTPQEQMELLQETDLLERKIVLANFCLNSAANFEVRQKPPNVNYQSPNEMPLEERWQLYFYWVQLYKKRLYDLMEQTNERFKQLNRQYAEVRTMEDVELLRNMDIVGMTTTGAARLQTLLQALACNIVLVEEAAEVLEAHIISAITTNCQHLILIGDHLQLRPSTAHYYIETKMKLGISLFERMVRNELHCSTLNVQHRMKPIIANLIRPAIYSALHDHATVTQYPPVVGINNSLYFIHHEEREEALGDTSKQNKHEAKFLVLLARHLILNGYEPCDITILAAYLGQKYAIDKEKGEYQHLLKHVRVAVLDNYQGEECKIILLSLVRNNNEKSIGFLKIENRVCVALSRAKIGFYIMGNINLLCDNSEIWPKIREVLEKQRCLGTSLKLQCAIHHDQITEVAYPKDFLDVMEGGCSLQCEATLICGHKCTAVCHVQDRDHQKFTCKQNCSRLLCENPNHKCKKLCFQKCGDCEYPVLRHLPCGHVLNLPCYVNPNTYSCNLWVYAKLPCGHETDRKPCYMKPEEFPCPFPCEIRVEPCGHQCQLTCHVRNDPDHIQYRCNKPCERYRKGCTTQERTHICPKFCYEQCITCEIEVEKKKSDCSHVFKVKCSEDVDKIVCTQNCKRSLPCGHFCKKKCNQPCGDCNVMVNKVLPECGHTMSTKCSQPPNKDNCTSKCIKKLACGHPCENKCNEICTVQCLQLVPSTVKPACGHNFTIPCHLRNQNLDPDDKDFLKHCKQPCQALLSCEHKCAGNCGECAQGRLHASCKEKCGLTLICGHECNIPCRLACQPCTKKCLFKCRHSKCGKLCSEPCTPCRERCSRKCKHRKCGNLCGQRCSVPPCYEACPKRLKCEHPCVGYCGEPCPPLCRVCDKDDLQEIFFGNEDEDDAKFVLLADCKHVLEGDGLDYFLKEKMGNDDGNMEINVICCPKCKTPITTTERYGDYVKAALHDISEVKRKSYGTEEENEEKRKELYEEAINFQALCDQVFAEVKLKLLKSVSSILTRLEPLHKNKRQRVNAILLSNISCKMQFLERITQNLMEYKNKEVPTKLVQHVEFLLDIIETNENISRQQAADLNMEVQRMIRMVQFYSITMSKNYKMVADNYTKVRDLTNRINAFIRCINKFEDTYDSRVAFDLKELNNLVKTSTIVTEKERDEIVRAIGLTQGHWFKCPNGHYYAIGECGGAMEKGRCFECKVEIGGTNHELLSTNQFAPEMDGASHPAWSNAANMRNYVF